MPPCRGPQGPRAHCGPRRHRTELLQETERHLSVDAVILDQQDTQVRPGRAGGTLRTFIGRSGPLRHRPPHDAPQMLEFNGLGKPCVERAVRKLALLLDRAHHNQGKPVVARMRGNAPGERQPVYLRHLHVEKCHLKRCPLVQHLKRFCPTRNDGGHEAPLPGEHRHHAPVHRIVVDD